MAQPSHETGFRQDVNRLGEGIDTLTTDVKGLARGAAEAARSGVAELRQETRHAVAAAKDKFEHAKDAAADTADSLKEVIARHPVASVGIAAGAGLLIGLFLFHRRG